jgi:hypothetical protein
MEELAELSLRRKKPDPKGCIAYNPTYVNREEQATENGFPAFWTERR